MPHIPHQCYKHSAFLFVRRARFDHSEPLDQSEGGTLVQNLGTKQTGNQTDLLEGEPGKTHSRLLSSLFVRFCGDFMITHHNQRNRIDSTMQLIESESRVGASYKVTTNRGKIRVIPENLRGCRNKLRNIRIKFTHECFTTFDKTTQR